ncbi:MAG: NifB/NifX family molybdenum-iron cluster-binding protein [Spirochaetales bacterium]|nr:NifB/NifX family molybdenum-iron cluster-binding protein [Spirochaetales bacterium]
MNIAFCLKENSIESELDGRFGRAQWFGIIDSETGEEVSLFENTAKEEPSGAGSKAVQLLLSNGAEAIIAPEFGPKAFDALKRFDLKLFKQGDHKTVFAALKAWRSGSLESPAAPGNSGLHKA